MLTKFKYLFLYLIAFAVSAIEAHEKTVCVSITTKNNATTIWRCLQSVGEIADCISICDLGSTDGTKKLAEEFLSITGIPGKITQREIQDLNLESGIAVQVAQKLLRHLGYPMNQTYLLMLEPDQVISSESIFNVISLEEECYAVLEKSSTLSCYSYKPNLFKASAPLDKIKEMLQSSGNSWRTIKKLRNLLIEDQLWPEVDTEGLTEEEIKDFYAKKVEELKVNRINQKMNLFSEAIKDDPDNRKYLLYLAQSHKCLKQYEEAISMYKDRISKMGDPEEVWFCKYMIGECYEEMGFWLHALYWYLEAYQFDPNRAESIRKIATYYRKSGQNEIAYLFAKHGLRIPKKGDETLFPSPYFSDYQFDEELSVTAYYTRFKNEGYAASNDLLLRRGVPNHIKDQAYRNILFYVENIKASFVPIKIPLPFVDGDTDEKYNPMNPSIHKTDDGYKLICRAVNYTQTGAKYFHTNDADGIFRTKNFLVYYDRQFKKLSHQEIIEDLPRDHYESFIIQGLEDCRIVKYDNSSWFTCSTFDTNPSGAIQISLCKMENIGFKDPVKIEKFLPLIGPDPNRHEKNWLPFVKDGELLVVYGTDPFTIYKPNLETGDCATVFEYTPEHDFSRFRGSASPIEFDEGYLMLIHEVIQHPDYSRTYLHRFVYLDKNFRVNKTSKPFTFNHIGIEYCLSMTIDHEGKQLVMPIGIEDREAFLMFVDLDEVRTLLNPLPQIFTPF